jgi:hypothetical protein
LTVSLATHQAVRVTTRRYATFDEAAMAIIAILDDGQWHRRTAEIGQLSRRSPWVSDAMYGKVKKHYKIEHRRVGGGPGGYVEWRRAKTDRKR